MTENCTLIIDYLVMSFKHESMDSLCKQLQLLTVNWQPIRSYYGYPTCYYFEGIKIHVSEELLVLDMSGKGCRTCETLNREYDFNWLDFLRGYDTEIKSREVNIARMDIACDVYDSKYFDYPKLVRYIRTEKFICKSDYYLIQEGNHEQSILFGSPRSDRRLRIYDKALEQKVDLEGFFWVRLEFQLRNENALSFYLNWSQVGHLGRCYSGVMYDYLRFTQKPNGKSMKKNGNQHRLEVCRWWSDFLGTQEGIAQAYLPGQAYTYDRLERYIRQNCASSLLTYLECNEGNVTELVEVIKAAKMNKRQLELLEQVRRQAR